MIQNEKEGGQEMKTRTPPAVTLCLAIALAFGGVAAAEESMPVDHAISEVMIPMADGGSLAAEVYLPGDGKYPTVLAITMGSKASCRRAFPRSYFFNSGDYAAVCVERRGSSGSRDNPRRPGVNPDGHDGHDVVEWIAAQPWSTGKVAMFGASNLGKIQYATAMTDPPHLTCIMPAETTPETREYGSVPSYEIAYPGGVLRLEMFQRAMGQGSSKQGQPGTGRDHTILDHPLDDEFYERLPEWPTLAEVKVPVLVVGSWFDNDLNRAGTQLFNRVRAGTGDELRESHRLLVGPWIHNGIYRDGWQGQMRFDNAAEPYRERERRFLDYWMRGIDTGEADGPRVDYYQMGRNEWRSADSWPPAGVEQVHLYLHPEGELAHEKPPTDAVPARFVSDPSNPVPTVGGQNKGKKYGKGPFDQSWQVENHPHVLIYASPVLKEDIDVVGDVKVKVWVSSDSEDTDVAFRLTDVYPSCDDLSERSMLIRDGIRRMSLRNSYTQYEFLEPGEVYEATIDTIPVAHTFRKGHRIRLIISSSNYPRWDVNTNTRDKSAAPERAVNRLHLDADHSSALILSVLEE
jgi:predicted acyl esterase